MSNPFVKFATKKQKVKIKSLNDYEVEVREPTILEVSEFLKELLDENGNVITSKFMTAKLKRVSECMINPKMSIDELTALGATSSDAINEVYEAIESLIVKQEGN